MTYKTKNYNLLEEDWIPVLRTNGKFEKVGIRKALTEAGRIRQIAASNPMDNVALLRLLLAVLHWCKPELTKGELERLQDKKARGIDPDWLEKKLGTAEQPHAAFRLLSDGSGFYQDHTAAGARVAVMNLLHDLPSGSKIAHFWHTRDGRDGMCLPCCAIGLVRWPGVASAGTAGGGQSMTASINGNTPAYSVPVSASLLSTLLFRWSSGQQVEADAPVWDGADEQSSLGLLKGLTWRSRSTLLAPPDGEGNRNLYPGRCCHCGEQTESLVRTIIFRPGWKRPFKEFWSDDPHLLQITRKSSGGVKEKKIVPSWPSPNDPLEDYAGVWRLVMEGHLQRSACSEASPTESHTTLLGNSQALYKDVGIHKAQLPRIDSDLAHCLLNEIDWLRKVTWITLAARGSNWRDPPKGHFVVRALCAAGAKGHAIRSALCTRSSLANCELEKAFLKLARTLAVTGRADGSAIDRELADWRSEVRRILRNHVEGVVCGTAPGSPLRRQEAMRLADEAVQDAVRQVETEGKKAADESKFTLQKR